MKPRPAPVPSTFSAALAWARRELHGSESAPLESAGLLSHVTEKPRAFLLAHPEEIFPPQWWNTYCSLVTRCAAGEPLPYLTGEQEFFGLPFTITPDVLIPRPETELLVELANSLLSDRLKGKAQFSRPLRVIDVGTGSGCIAVALTVRTAGLRMIASDISAAGLAVAARNASRHNVAGRISLVQADLLAPFRGPFDLVCANLPYIPTGVLGNLPVNRFEPRIALDGGPDGMRFLERLLAQAQTRLAPGGCVLLEIESSLGSASMELARRFFPESQYCVHKDFADKDRVLAIRRRNPGQTLS